MPDPAGLPVALRAGIAGGDTVVEGGDAFGACVDIAARPEAEAAPAGLMLSREMRDLAGGGDGHEAGALRAEE